MFTNTSLSNEGDGRTVRSPGKLLKVGDRFETVLGPSRLIYADDLSYFVKNNRRYFCKVISWVDKQYRHRNETRVRRHLVVEVVEK